MELLALVKEHEKVMDNVFLALKLYDTKRNVFGFNQEKFMTEINKFGHDSMEVYNCKCIQDWRNGK